MRLTATTFDPERAERATFPIDAVDEVQARFALEARGLIVLSIKTSAGVFGFSSAARFAARTTVDVRLICIEVSALLRAGLSLAEAIESLTLRSEDRSAKFYNQVMQNLLKGLPLSDAVEETDYSIPPILVAAIRANERTGRVADALDEFARFEGTLRDLRNKAISAAVYPLLVVAFGLLVAAFLLGYVVPRFSAIYDGTAINMSLPTRVILVIGQSIDEFKYHIAFIFLVLTLIGWRALAYGGVRQRVRSSLLSTWPLASYVRLFQLQRICQSLAMLLRGGYPLPEALTLADALATQPRLTTGLESMAVAIGEGRAASSAWVESGLGDQFARRILQAGERTGELSVGFDTLAGIYSRSIEVAMERSARLIEPTLLMLVASLIGAIVVLMYMPIFDLAGTVQ